MTPDPRDARPVTLDEQRIAFREWWQRERNWLTEGGSGEAKAWAAWQASRASQSARIATLEAALWDIAQLAEAMAAGYMPITRKSQDAIKAARAALAGETT